MSPAREEQKKKRKRDIHIYFIVVVLLVSLRAIIALFGRSPKSRVRVARQPVPTTPPAWADVGRSFCERHCSLARVPEVTRTGVVPFQINILISSSCHCRFTTRGRYHSSSLSSSSFSSIRSLASVQLSVEERWCVTEGKGSGKAGKEREKEAGRESECRAEKCTGVVSRNIRKR